MAPLRTAASLLALACGVLLAPAAAGAAQVYFIYHDYEPDVHDRNAFVLERMNGDGTGREVVVPDIGLQPAQNSLTVHGDRVYWRTYEGNMLHAATTDGVLLGAVPAPNDHVRVATKDRALDAAGRYTYYQTFRESGFDGRIVRAAEGEPPQTLVEVRQFEPGASVVLDEPAGKIYWAGSFNSNPSGLVQRANLADGSDVETLLENFASDDTFVDLSLDPAGGKMYLGNVSLWKIQRANLDGTGLEDLVTDLRLFGVAVDAAPVPEPGVAGLLVVTWVMVRRARFPRPDGA